MRTLIASDFVTSLRAFAAAAPSRIPSTRFQMAQIHPLAIAHASFATHTHPSFPWPRPSLHLRLVHVALFPLYYFAFFGHGVVQQFRFVAFAFASQCAPPLVLISVLLDTIRMPVRAHRVVYFTTS